MGISNNKKVIIISCLSIVLMASLSFGIYKYITHQVDSTKLKEASINTSGTRNTSENAVGDQTSRISVQSNVGNANYFNELDGIYYADSNFTIEADDNTTYILSLFSSEVSVNLPAGNFLCKTKIILNGEDLSVIGIEGKTKIVFDSKTFTNYGAGYISECLIMNRNYADKYKADSAQSINISGITFEYMRYSENSPNTIMLFKNIRAANIKNCSFVADLSNAIPVTNLDFYNGCKNVIVTDCYFSNKTKALSGGCIWVRNLTAEVNAIEGNTTENINISKCSFDKDSKDEVIAVYSVVGDVKDVIISNCEIRDYFNKQQIVLMVCSSEDKYYGTVDNVIISNNNIYSQNYNAFIILIGIDNRVKPTTNVIIEKNKIVSETQSIKSKTILYNAASNKGSNIIINNNDITANKSPYFASIANATYTGGNKITGNFDSGIIGGTVVNNTIIGANNGIVNPVFAFNNTISQIKYGIRVFNGDSYLNRNSIVLDRESGICGIEVTSQDYVTCTKNIVQTFNKNQYGIIARSANTILNNNQVLSEGKSSIGK